jgi:hypothetical protein
VAFFIFDRDQLGEFLGGDPSAGLAFASALPDAGPPGMRIERLHRDDLDQQLGDRERASGAS